MSISEFGWYQICLIWRNIEDDSHSLWRYFPWINYRSMRMVYAILHTISKGKELWFCGRIHVSTQLHGHISKVVSCLKSNLHEISYPVVEWYSMCFSSCFNYYPTSGVAMKTSFSNDVSVGKGDFWNLIYYFYLLANNLE